MSKVFLKICTFCFASLVTHSVLALDGINIAELPIGGNVTVPGDFPVIVRKAHEAQLQSVSNPQSLQFNSTSGGIVHLSANHEKKLRVLNVKPGVATVYSFKSALPIRVKVVSGEVRISSVSPLKVQH